jgi:hypothetical protein
MMLCFVYLALAALLIGAGLHCKPEREPNLVEYNQVNDDNSTNYKHIFRDQIRKEDRDIQRHHRDTFQEPREEN